MTNSIPNSAHAIIIGAMKCGTSSLYDYLAGHPQICAAASKESEYFSENQWHGKKVNVEHYCDLFDFDPSVHKFTLDGSTGYTKYPSEPNVAKNIKDYGISPRFIYIMRNPFDRIESHFNYQIADNSWDMDLTDNHLIRTSNYFLQLDQYRNHFPIKDVLLLDFEDLKNDPAAVLRSVYDFLDLPHNHFPAAYGVINKTQVRSDLEKKFANSIGAKFMRLLPKSAKDVIKSGLRTSARTDKKRVLSKTEKSFVHDQLHESMKDLHQVYGFDPSSWGFEV